MSDSAAALSLLMKVRIILTLLRVALAASRKPIFACLLLLLLFFEEKPSLAHFSGFLFPPSAAAREAERKSERECECRMQGGCSRGGEEEASRQRARQRERESEREGLERGMNLEGGMRLGQGFIIHV